MTTRGIHIYNFNSNNNNNNNNVMFFLKESSDRFQIVNKIFYNELFEIRVYILRLNLDLLWFFFRVGELIKTF
jgi:hypothetical protein